MSPAIAPPVPARERSTPAPPPESAPAAAPPAAAPAAPLQRAAIRHGLAPLAPVPAGRRVLQRFAWPTGEDPAAHAGGFAAINAWLTHSCWPLGLTMEEWVQRSAANADVQQAWRKLKAALDAAKDPKLAARHLGVAVGRLKGHIESTYESTLTTKEVEEKTTHVDNLIKAIGPDAFADVWDREQYKDALVGKVLASPRYMLSIKIKDPFVQHRQDDDASPTGFNATLIRNRIDEVRKGADLMASLKPGTDTEWAKWRENDCLFAAILAVLLKNKAPKTDDKDQEMAVRLAAELNVARGVVDDPVILALMERLGWQHTRHADWAAFTAHAAQTSLHVVSLDTTRAGNAAHVVVASYSRQPPAWRIYDRQAVRLKRPPLTTAPFPNNPLDSWQVQDTDAANELRDALS